MTKALTYREEPVKVIVCPYPFSSVRVEGEFEAGPSVGTLLMSAGMECGEGLTIRVLLDDQVVELQDFYTVIPQPGQMLTARVVPQDPGTIGLILIAVAKATAVAAAKIGVTGLAAKVVGGIVATLYVAGFAALTVSAVQTLSASSSRSSPAEPTPEQSPTITGARNALRQFSPVPRIYGEHRVRPMFGAKPFTEIIGGEQFLRLLFVPGYGPLELDETEFKIGDTPLSDFVGVETEVREGYLDEAPLTLFSNEVDELAIGVLFPWRTAKNAEPEPSLYVARTAAADGAEIGIGLVFPQGIIGFDSHGGEWAVNVRVKVQYRAAGSSDSWIDPSTADMNVSGQPGTTVVSGGVVNFHGKTVDTMLRGFKFTVPRGNWEVQLRRELTWADSHGSTVSAFGWYTNQFGDFTWSLLQTIRPLDPIKLNGIAKIALRIQASDNLNGVVDQFSCLVKSLHDVYDPTHPLADADGIVANVHTRNPAWHCLDILKGTANKSAVALSRINLTALQSWAADNEANSFNFDGVFDFEGNVQDAFNSVAAVGRASLYIQDDKFTVVQDKKQTAVVQHFTPRNSSNFRGSKAYLDLPHGLRVRFLNRNEDYKQDEMLVFADGFDESTATKYEAIDVFGITDPEHLWQDTRFRQAVAENRNEAFELDTDFEYLVCSRGDLVRVTHDVALIGLAAGRITAFTTDVSDDIVTITMDEEMTFEGGKGYGCRLRTINAAGDTVSTAMAVTNPANGGPVTTNTLTVADTVPDSIGIAVDDLMMFGEFDVESEEFVVKEIEPHRDLGATLALLPHAPAIFDADAGPIPHHESVITFPLDGRPPTPVIEKVEAVAGRLLLTVRVSQTAAVRAVRFETQFRVTDPQSGWGILAETSATQTQINIAPVAQGVRYDIRVRSISASGIPSPFAEQNAILFDGDVVFAADFEVRGLELVGQGNVTAFTGRDPQFTWRLNSPRLGDRLTTLAGLADPFGTEHPFFQSYEVRILDATTQEVLRTEQVIDTHFTYNFEKNVEDRPGPGANRTFTIDVAFRDVLSNVGERASLTVSNPAPLAPLNNSTDFTLFSSLSQLWATFNIPRDPDYRSMLMFVRATSWSGGDPVQSELKSDQYGSPILREDIAGTTRYVKLAPYDDFAYDATTGKVDLSQLNFTGEEFTTVQSLSADDLEANAITLFQETELASPIIDIFSAAPGWGTWVDVLTVPITTVGGRVFISAVMFATVISLSPDIGRHVPETPLVPEDLFEVPRLRYRILRDAGVIFTSDVVNLSVAGYFAAGAVSRFDDPGAGSYTYKIQILWENTEYRQGEATYDHAGNPAIVTGIGTRWEDSGFNTTGAVFRWSDQDIADAVDVATLQNNGQLTLEVTDPDYPPPDKTAADYILSGFYNSSQNLVLDISQCYMQASEFRR